MNEIFRFDYPVWPEGLMPRVVVRTHALSVNLPRWRTGVVLEFEGNRALVRAEPRDKHVIISIGGPTEGRRQLLAIIRSDFERIHSDIPRLAPVASVPLPDAPSQVIRYDELMGPKQSGITSVTRVVGESPVSHAVSSLLATVDVPSGSIGRPIRLFVSYSHKMSSSASSSTRTSSCSSEWGWWRGGMIAAFRPAPSGKGKSTRT